ncbi:MAG: ABC transporter ATP-binding protein [Planctomycetaceae bacterium]
MTPALSLKSVSKSFGRVTALREVSIDVPPGRVCAVLGANGAGKSTMIRILLGLETPDAGSSQVLGMDSRTHGLEIRRRVGYMPEKPTLYDWMSVEEIGWFAAGFYASGFQAHYDQYIRHFQVDPTQKIKHLSKGTRAKVSLSLSLAHKPELLILDEPTSGLDPLVRREFLESMVDVAAEGRTVLLSSHQVSEVERVADMVVILLGGELVCVEALDDLKRTTREVVATLPDAATEPPPLAGQVLAHARFGHEHVWMVRGFDESSLERWSLPEGAAFHVNQPSLEDILLALLREYRRSPVARPNAASASVGIS